MQRDVMLGVWWSGGRSAGGCWGGQRYMVSCTAARTTNANRACSQSSLMQQTSRYAQTQRKVKCARAVLTDSGEGNEQFVHPSDSPPAPPSPPMAPLTLLALAMGLHCTVFEYLAPYTCDPFQVAPKMFQQKTVPKPGHASKGRIHTVGRSTYMVRVGTVGTWAGKQDLAQRAAQCSNDAVSRAALRAASRPAALLTDESLRRMVHREYMAHG